MMLEFSTTLSDADRDLFDVSPELSAVTLRYGKVQEVAMVGEMFNSLVGDNVYLWLHMAKKQLTREELRQGKLLATRYLDSLPWTPMAECAINDDVGQRFLVHLGFIAVQELPDRLVFQRS